MTRKENMFRLDVPTKRGSVLNGALFRQGKERTADTVMIAITGIHGNFYSNPFYYNIGDTLNAGGIDFVYAQTCDAFGQIRTFNVKTKREELIGSWNERFSYVDEDIDAYKMRKHKTALITGASGGLGAEFAKQLAEKKYNLILVARNEGKLYALKNELETKYGVSAHVCAADLSVPDAALDVYNDTLEHELPVDVLINNAGFGDSGSFADSDWMKQYRMVQVNITALMQLTHCFLPGMLEAGRGRILNVSSVAAFSAGPYMSVYYASKAFVRSFSEAVAEEVKGTGVTVTALLPGPTATGFEQAASMKANSAMFRKAARPSEVVKAGLRAMRKGKVLRYVGGYTGGMNLLSRILPRSAARKYAGKMNRE